MSMRIVALQFMCDDVRARLMYDKSRSIVTHDAHVWVCLGWDVGQQDGVGFKHPAEAIRKIFYAPAWRPTQGELAWFREGFVLQRKGSPRPVIRG